MTELIVWDLAIMVFVNILVYLHSVSILNFDPKLIKSWVKFLVAYGSVLVLIKIPEGLGRRAKSILKFSGYQPHSFLQTWAFFLLVIRDCFIFGFSLWGLMLKYKRHTTWLVLIFPHNHWHILVQIYYFSEVFYAYFCSSFFWTLLDYKFFNRLQ